MHLLRFKCRIDDNRNFCSKKFIFLVLLRCVNFQVDFIVASTHPLNKSNFMSDVEQWNSILRCVTFCLRRFLVKVNVLIILDVLSHITYKIQSAC